MAVSDIAGHEEGISASAMAVLTGAPPTEGKWGFIYTCAGGFIDLGHAHDYVDLVHYHYQMLLLKHSPKNTYKAPHDDGLVTVKKSIPKTDLIKVAKSISFYQSLWHEIWTYWLCAGSQHSSSFSPEDLFSNAVGIHAGAKATLATSSTFNANAKKELVGIINALGPVSVADTNKAFDAVTGTWVSGGWLGQDYLKRRNFSYNPVKPWLVPGLSPCASSTGAIPADFSATFDAELQYYDVSFPILIPSSAIGQNPLAGGNCYDVSGPHGFVNSSPISVTQFPAEIENIKKAAVAKYGANFDSPT